MLGQIRSDWVQDGQEDEETTWFFTIPYVENVSEAVARIMRKHSVPMAMKPYRTLKTVHQKDKQEKEDLTWDSSITKKADREIKHALG